MWLNEKYRHIVPTYITGFLEDVIFGLLCHNVFIIIIFKSSTVVLFTSV